MSAEVFKNSIHFYFQHYGFDLDTMRVLSPAELIEVWQIESFIKRSIII